MEYGIYYRIDELARASEFYLSLIDKVDIRFFAQNVLPYDRGEIMKTIQIGAFISSQDKVPLTSHPAIHSAIQNQTFYKEKVDTLDYKDKAFYSNHLYTTVLSWLVTTMIGLINNVYEKRIEIEISNKEYIEAIKFMTIEKQKDEYYKTNPNKVVEKYREYLNKRIKDLNELIEIDRLDLGTELKEIVRSYKLGLEINVSGRNLLTPLLEKNYDKFVENLKNTLLIPSYHDVYKKEKERYYHIYLLGVLEGRLNFYQIHSNKESGFGRYDICGIPLKKSNPGFIIEVKSDKSVSIEEALQQIKKNEYSTQLKNDGVKEIMILAINFQETIDTKYDIIKL